MIKFIRNTILFLTVTLLIAIIAAFAFLKVNSLGVKDIPAPNISESYSFNEKALFMRNVKNNDAEVLVLGSSISLNNLHSNTIIQELKSEKVLNTASWGLSITDNFNYLKRLQQVYNIKSIIIAGTIVDFKNPEKRIDYDLFDEYLKNKTKPELFFHLKHFNIQYYVTNFLFAKQCRNDMFDYHYLNFDKQGSLNFPDSGFKISQERWNQVYIEKPPSQKPYDYLDSICKFCIERNIQLFFFQSPMKQSTYTKLNINQLRILNDYEQKVQSIIKSNNQLYVNTMQRSWADSLFADGIHLNKNGAKAFTQFCFNQLKQKK